MCCQRRVLRFVGVEAVGEGQIELGLALHLIGLLEDLDDRLRLLGIWQWWFLFERHYFHLLEFLGFFKLIRWTKRLLSFIWWFHEAVERRRSLLLERLPKALDIRGNGPSSRWRRVIARRHRVTEQATIADSGKRIASHLVAAISPVAFLLTLFADANLPLTILTPLSL